MAMRVHYGALTLKNSGGDLHTLILLELKAREHWRQWLDFFRRKMGQ